VTESVHHRRTCALQTGGPEHSGHRTTTSLLGPNAPSVSDMDDFCSLDSGDFCSLDSGDFCSLDSGDFFLICVAAPRLSVLSGSNSLVNGAPCSFMFSLLEHRTACGCVCGRMRTSFQ
jgi:hypothetical protein